VAQAPLGGAAAVNLLFVLSYWLDVQLVEGSLTGSRLLGFHLIDLNAALRADAGAQTHHREPAHRHGTVGCGVALLGGRSFCSWVCPYHLLSEWAEKLHL
jgi:ferredoxin-type protein NapH